MDKIDLKNKGQVVSALKALQASPGWGIMQEVIDINLKFIEESILTKLDSDTGEELSEASLDYLRQRRSVMKEFRNKPQLIIDEHTRVDKKLEDFDPYYKTKKEQ